jgi:hypothetical protein
MPDIYYIGFQYHLACIDMEQVSKTWICMSCMSSGLARGGKHSRVGPRDILYMVVLRITSPQVHEKKKTTLGRDFGSRTPLANVFTFSVGFEPTTFLGQADQLPGQGTKG